MLWFGSIRGLGAKIKEVSIPLLAQTEKAGNRIAWAEASCYHQQSGWFPARGAEYSEDVRSRLETGMKVLAVEYLEAQDQRRSFISQLREVMEKEALDALMVPTTPIAAPLIGEEITRVGKIDHLTRALLLRLNRPGKSGRGAGDFGALRFHGGGIADWLAIHRRGRQMSSCCWRLLTFTSVRILPKYRPISGPSSYHLPQKCV